ncbi:MAG: putative DNA-binding domain-containing protein [Burkholderiaceae bacterium]|nr:putative DNA-binding domain-containing protein [Burkholderiaceae bacterium]
MDTSSDFHGRFLTSIDGWRLVSGLDVDAAELGHPPAMGVYANTGLRAAIEALEANFLSVANWLGGPWFWPVARAFARAHPPSEGRLFLYGDGFPEFLAELEHGDLGRCASELAWVDWMCMRAHAAADHLPLGATDLAALPAETLLDMRLQVAPSTRWRKSPDYALVALWRAARTGQMGSEFPAQPACGVLVTRPDDAVLVNEVPLASLSLLDALSAGLELGAAAEQAMRLTPPHEAFDLQQAIGALLDGGALSALQEPTR